MEASSELNSVTKNRDIKRKLKEVPKKIKRIQNEDFKERNRSDSETELKEPTDQELMESINPENIKNIETIRQKKKLKHNKISKEKKNQTQIKEITKNIEYLQKWKKSKSEWKFEKLRQISIQNALFDVEKIGEDIWELALEYICGTKGDSRIKIIRAAENEIEKFDNQIDKLENHSLLNSTGYNRARQLLQSFSEI